jgi:peptide/nickel transport system ATP-binding protein
VQESGAARDVFAAPRTGYARSLQADVPALHPDRYRNQRVVPASGTVHHGDSRTETATSPLTGPHIKVQDVTKRFTAGGKEVLAVNGVSFSVDRGRTHALVGESGSGKTTAVRLLLGLEQADGGHIAIAGQSISGRSRAEVRDIRRHLQLVYQNPFTSLDPTWPVGKIIREPLDQFNVGTKAERAQRVREAVEAVGLHESVQTRRPAQLSGGQRQRVAIARALVLRPDVVVLDEPTSALDVSVQAGILELLSKLQRDLGLTYLFVSHDLALVRQVADTVSVLQGGQVVEDGPVEDIFLRPRHPYTRALLEAIPLAAHAAKATTDTDTDQQLVKATA